MFSCFHKAYQLCHLRSAKFIKLKPSISYDVLCIAGTYAYKANVSDTLQGQFTCYICNVIFTRCSTKVYPATSHCLLYIVRSRIILHLHFAWLMVFKLHLHFLGCMFISILLTVLSLMSVHLNKQCSIRMIVNQALCILFKVCQYQLQQP